MSKISSLLTAVMLTMTLLNARAQEYSVALIDAAPEADQLSPELAKQFADRGIRIKRGSSRTACEIWLCEQWPIDADFKASDQRLYPFSSGQLIGLLHFTRKGADFRGQTIGSGWYTLRFGLQPVDGNHVGTSLTRDFLVMLKAEHDAPDKQWALKDLQSMSAKAAGSSHPAMICLQSATEGASPAIRHDEANDWWILHAMGQGTAADTTQDVPVDLVVVGHAAE